MGKYMRKAKGAGEVAVMELSSQSSLGVRTRARTRTLLALQKDQNKKATSAPHKPPKICIEPMKAVATTTSYLELRSRRLEKAAPCCATAPKETPLKNMGGGLYSSGDSERRRNLRADQQQHSHSHSAFMVSEERQPKSKTKAKLSMPEQMITSRGGRRVSSTVGYSRSNSTSFSQVCSKVKAGRAARKDEVNMTNVEAAEDIGPQSSTRAQEAHFSFFEDETPTPMEASFGENAIDQDSRDRHIREATPSSLIGDGETLEAPGSTTRPTCRSSARRRLQNEGRRNAPTSREMEEFFAGAEQQQQRRFIERYNYDPVNDLPLPGRYDWFRL